jgi:hypothetical protein
LAEAAVGFARDRGARSLEGYPMETGPDQEVGWGELYVGSRGIFEAAGFREVSKPSPRRVVMRIDFPTCNTPTLSPDSTFWSVHNVESRDSVQACLPSLRYMRFFVRAVAGAVHGSSGHGCFG